MKAEYSTRKNGMPKSYKWIQPAAFAVALCIGAPARSASPAPAPHIALAEGSGVPESLSAAADGSVFVGSADKGMILRAAPGASIAKQWVKLSGDDPVSVLGVVADDRRGLVWACTFELAAGAPMTQRRFALRSFDIATGAVKALLPSPGCNDLAIDKSGVAYITDTENSRLLRLRSGAGQVEPWLTDSKLSQANGIAFAAGKLYVGASNTLNRVDIQPDGAAGAVTPLKLDRPLRVADGIRPAGAGPRLLIAEMGSPLIKNGVIGQLSLATIKGDVVTLTVLGRGYQSPTSATAAGPRTALILESKLPYWWDPEIRGKDPGQVHIFALPIP